MPNGRLVSGSGDGTIRTWDTISGACLLIVACHSKVRALAVLPEGKLALMMAQYVCGKIVYACAHL
jgi:WD40 repeat protein